MNVSILGLKVEVTSLLDSMSKIIEWISQTNDKARYICVSNVHMCMEGYDNKSYQNIINNADLVVPDGKPLVLSQKILGFKKSEQVRGMDLMLALCEFSAKAGIPIGIYGATVDLLSKLEKSLISLYPSLKIVSLIAPPFRELSESENDLYIKNINEAGVRVLFVGIGCPKQEFWMAHNKDKLSCVMLGVGAAFDFIAGDKKHAPRWMQNLSLEWFFRLLCEPRRLWRRYFWHNPRFIWFFLKQALYKN